MLADDSENDAITMSNQDSVSIPFGSPIVFKPSSTSDKDGALPANSTDVLAGVLIHSHDFERTFSVPDSGGPVTVGELDTTGVAVGAEMAVLTKGTIWVLVHTAVVAGNAVHYSFSSNVTYSAAGQWGATAESGHSVLVSNARWASSADASKFAKLRLGHSSLTAD
jgi:hypothetical protein